MYKNSSSSDNIISLNIAVNSIIQSQARATVWPANYTQTNPIINNVLCKLHFRFWSSDWKFQRPIEWRAGDRIGRILLVYSVYFWVFIVTLTRPIYINVRSNNIIRYPRRTPDKVNSRRNRDRAKRSDSFFLARWRFARRNPNLYLSGIFFLFLFYLYRTNKRS